MQSVSLFLELRRIRDVKHFSNVSSSSSKNLLSAFVLSRLDYFVFVEPKTCSTGSTEPKPHSRIVSSSQVAGLTGKSTTQITQRSRHTGYRWFKTYVQDFT